MITRVTVNSFKSIANVDIELGNLNVFVGANGSGKSNLLEAIGVLSAAADGKVTIKRCYSEVFAPGFLGSINQPFRRRELSRLPTSISADFPKRRTMMFH
jgi:energy-coupling factor transporter ATP-binding protein EcfA2